jgi:hypothetical protein
MLETNGGTKAAEIESVNFLISGMTSAKAVSSLAFNMSSVAAQADSGIRFLLDLPAKEIALAFSDPVELLKTVPKAWKSPTVQRILKYGSSPAVRYLYEKNAADPGALSSLIHISMQPLQLVDSALTSFSLAVVFRAKYTMAKKAGMNETMAITEGVNAMDRAWFRYSQPIGFGGKSLVENRGNIIFKMMMLFMTDPRRKAGIMLDAAMALKQGRGNKADHIRRIVAIEMMALVSHVVISGYKDMFSDAEDEDIWGWEGFVRALILAPFSGYFVVGAAINAGVSLALGERVFKQAAIPVLDSVDRAARASKNIGEIFNTDDPDAMFREWDDLARSMTILGPLFGAQVAAPAAAINAMRPVVGLIQNNQSED